MENETMDIETSDCQECKRKFYLVEIIIPRYLPYAKTTDYPTKLWSDGYDNYIDYWPYYPFTLTM